MDKKQKEQLGKLVKFLGEVLGQSYEVVLHDITEKGAYIAAIENNHISNRSVNSPLTGFALELLKNEEYKDNDYLINYKAMTKRGNSVRGSTFFIKDDDKIQ
nr:PAS domain-containing protein [Campylobacter geochelonis]